MSESIDQFEAGLVTQLIYAGIREERAPQIARAVRMLVHACIREHVRDEAELRAQTAQFLSGELPAEEPTRPHDLFCTLATLLRADASDPSIDVTKSQEG